MIIFYFIAFIVCLIGLRLVELRIAKSNGEWLKDRGAVEYGRAHYPFMIALHTSFILSLIIEYWLMKEKFFNVWLLLLFVGVSILKVLVVSTLGRYWTTRIYRIPGTPLVAKGIYRYVRHPNYIIVIIEIAIIPLIFSLYYTAAIFSVLNGLMLYVRIKEEERALDA